MADVLLLGAAQLCSFMGMGWLALAKKEHWRQLRGAAPLSSAMRRALRSLGAVALTAALGLCLSADHASMAALVWIMGLSASAFGVALTLAWRPRWLSWLVPWTPRARHLT